MAIRIQSITLFLKKNRYAVALLTLWFLAILIVKAFGDFPLNDDFSYSKSVYNLCVGGHFLLDDWPAMTLITQLFYGAIWCELFGFSFEILRFSTLFIAGGCLLLFFRFLVAQGFKQQSAFAMAIVLAANPLFFSLSFTFMTEVHFLFWTMAALWSWAKYLQTGKSFHYLLAVIFSLAMVLLRQTGLLVPLAGAVAMIVKESGAAKVMLKAIFPLGLCLLTLIGYTYWLEKHQGLPPHFGNPGTLFRNLISANHLRSIPQRLVILVAYMGLFSLPLTLQFKADHLKKRKSDLILVLIYCAMGWLFREKVPWGNVIYNLGLGPTTLKDGQYFLNLRNQLNGLSLEALRLVFIGSGAWFLWVGLSFLRNIKWGVESWLLAICILGYTAYLLLDTYAFDRYFLTLFFFLLLLFSFGKWQFSFSPISWLAVVLIALCSITATHDYLSWNRARWSALDSLTTELNISPAQIDGGFEFNGWHRPGPLEYGKAKSWWWVAQDEYCVTFGPLDGYQCVKKIPFCRWLPPVSDSLCILKKN